MFQAETVNTSHIEGGITVGSVITGLMLFCAILTCCIRVWNGKTPCGTSCSRGSKDEDDGKNKPSRSWRFRRRKSSSSDDIVDMVSTDSTPPTAPPMLGAPPAQDPNSGTLPRQIAYPNLDSMPSQDPGNDPRPKYILDLGSLIRHSQQ